jgi:hypothetical protein
MVDKVFTIIILLILIGTFFICIPTIIYKDMKGDRVGALLVLGSCLLFVSWIMSMALLVS